MAASISHASAPVHGVSGWLSRARRIRARGLLVVALALAIVASIGIAVASISTAPTGQKSWYWQNPTPQGNTLYGIAAPGGGRMWAVGGPGVILHSTDGGIVWDAQDSNTVATLRAVDFAGADTGWAVGLSFGGAGTIRSTVDGGSTWTTQTSGTSESLYGVARADADHGWVVGANGTILVTADGGSTWTAQSSGTTELLRAVTAVDADTAWVVGDTGTIICTVDGGSTWNAQTSNTTERLNAVSFVSATTGWAVGGAAGGASTVLKTTDGGSTWMTRTVGSDVDLHAVSFVSASTGWVVGDDGLIKQTTDGGSTWTTQTSGPPQLLAIAAESGTRAFAVGASGAMLRTADAGSTWSAQSLGTAADLAGVSFPDGANGYAVGRAGAVVRTTDGGVTWTGLASGTANDLSGVDFPDSSHGWAVGAQGTIRATADGGSTWTTQSSDTTEPLRAVTAVDADTAWVVGGAGTIKGTTDGGSTWTTQTSDTTATLDAVSFISATTGWAVGGAAGGASTVLKTTDGGSTWMTQTVGSDVDLHAVSFVSASTGWVVGDDGLIKQTTDGGSTWTAQTAPIGMTMIYGVDFSDADHGRIVGALYGNRAVIAITTDGGATWVAQSSGTVNALRSVDCLDADRCWTVGDSGTILRTTDAAAPSTTLSIAPAAPDGANGWYVSAPALTLTSSEVGITRYSLNSEAGPFQTYSSPVVASSPGTVTVRYYSVDPGGNRESTQSATIKVDLMPASVPASVGASTLSTTSVRVRWLPSLDTVSGVAYYELWQDASRVGTTTATSTIVASLTPEALHTYSVRSVDVAGNASVDSTSATISTLALVSRPPANVYARHTYRGLFSVDWDEPTSTVGTVAYRVWRSDAGGPYVSIGNVAGLLARSYVDTTAPDPTPIAYAISVVDSRGEGPLSMAFASASATTPVLPAPTRLRAFAATGSVETSWASLPSTSVAGYVVLRSETSTGAPVTVTPSPVVTPAFADASAVAHTEYWYRVAAIALDGVRGTASLPVHVRAASSATAEVAHGSFTTDTAACALCHSAHTAVNATSLLKTAGTDELPLCFSCHDGTSASDVFTEFSDTSRADRHSVAAGSMPGTTRCAACHDPHGDKGAAARRRLLYNGGARTGDAVCYNGCHGTTATVTPPRGDLSVFESSGHASATPLPADGTKVKCLSCHVSHSSRERSLVPYAPDDRCVTCHSADGALPGAADILRSLSGPDPTTRLDLLEADQAATGARIACGNCHEPHSSTPTTKLVDPNKPKTTGGWSGSIDDFCLRCHDAALPTSADTTGWVLPPLGVGGTSYTSDIASRWAGDVHGAIVRTPSTLRSDMGYVAGDPVGCKKCHDEHGSSNRWALRESVTSKSGTATVSGLLVYPVGGGADVRYFCNACHDVTAASHPTTASGGADISVFPMDCTANGCHVHGVTGL